MITKKTEQVNEIIELLMNDHLITGVTVLDSVSSFKNKSGKIETVLTNLLIGRTKAMLFNKIEGLLVDKYGSETPVIYGLPIVNMDLAHIEKLKMVIHKN